MAKRSDMSHPVTRGELREELAPYATKLDLERFATKVDLERFATKLDLERYATKLDLETWGFALKDHLDANFARFAKQISDDLARQVRVIDERQRTEFVAVDDQYKDLPGRVAKLEAEVFPPKE